MQHVIEGEVIIYQWFDITLTNHAKELVIVGSHIYVKNALIFKQQLNFMIVFLHVLSMQCLRILHRIIVDIEEVLDCTKQNKV